MDWTTAVLYQDKDHHGRYTCTVCPFRCSVSEGQLGACRVRRGGPAGMETATFATSVVHVDEVERKPLYHYRPGTPAVTLAAPGCSFRCDYCVNHQLSQFGREDAVPWTGRPVIPEDIVSTAADLGGCVAFSYSEPSLAIELTLALARHGGPAGVEIVWKTNGFLTPEAVAAVAPSLAAVNIDVKAIDDARHRRLTGAPAKPVLDAIAALRDRGVWVEVTTPMIPGVCDTPDDLDGIASALAGIDPGLPWHLARFTPAFRMTPQAPTSPAAMAEAVAIGKSAGLRHVYVERALGEEGRSTRCPACDATVVERDVWKLKALHLDGGRCHRCGTRIEGRW